MNHFISRFTVDPDIAKAKTPDKDFYLSNEWFEYCREKLFSACWQFIGSTDLVKEPGDICPLVLLENFMDEPLVLTHQHNSLHLLSNVCTHRGNIITQQACHATHLRCAYHGRLFRLDGKFHAMPEFREVLDFPSAEDDLRQLPLFRWGNWLFTSLRPAPEPALFFEAMRNRINWLPIHDFQFRPNLSRSFTVNAHWALYCENYLEGFHIPFVHAGLNAVIDFGNYTTELFRWSNLQLGIAKDNEDCFDLPVTSPDYGKKVAAYYFFVFPNMMFNFYPWGLSVNIVQPAGIAETTVRFYTYIWDESKYNTGAGSGLDEVEMEDEEVVENVQKGIRSAFYRHGRYSVTREQGTHHFHRMIAEWVAANG